MDLSRQLQENLGLVAMQGGEMSIFDFKIFAPCHNVAHINTRFFCFLGFFFGFGFLFQNVAFSEGKATFHVLFMHKNLGMYFDNKSFVAL